MITDVSGAISGYYKQIYVAIKELLSLKSNNASVGIECGADVRVFHTPEINESIEVKFYKNNIGFYSTEIAKTVFNFYSNSFNDIRLEFNTNTQIPHLFDQKTLGKKDRYCYILHMLITHELNRSKDNKERIIDYFEKKSIQCGDCKSQCCNRCIEKFVNKFNENYPSEFENIIPINTKVDMNTFSSRITFNFEDNSKTDSISIIKNEMKDLLRENYKELVVNLNDIILEAIIHKIAICFFDSSVFNSLLRYTDLNNDYNNHKKLSRLDVVDLISNYKDFLNEYREDILELRILGLIDRADLNREKIIFKYNQEYNEYLSSKENIKVYNSSTIKEYFREIKFKFKTEDERAILVKRFENYNKGFRLISYLMSMEITEITIFKEKLFLKAEDDKIKIDNLDYYSFSAISDYIANNKESEDDSYRYLQSENFSLLECISPNCVTPFIVINKSERKITLDEYQKVNCISQGVINQLNNLVELDKSMLIISRAPFNRKPFLNALLSSIPKSKTFFTIAEDFKSLPSYCIGRSYVFADSLKENYKERIERIAFSAGLYDKCIAFLDNYELDLTKAYKNMELLLEHNKCLISTLHRDVSRLKSCNSFHEVCNELVDYNKLDFSVFESIIVIDSHNNNGKKRDNLKVFTRFSL